MKLPFRQSWQLRRIERELRRSELHLAGMLAIFAKLNAGETILSREQEHRPGFVLAVLAGIVAGCAAAGRWVLGRAARLCSGARRRLGPVARALGVAPSAAGNSVDSRRSLGL